MDQKQKLIVASLLFATASIFSIVTLIKEQSAKNRPLEAELVLYYGITCPHCKIVEDYIANNGLANKLKIEQKEIFENQANQREMAQNLAACGRQEQGNLYVPMLFDVKNRACYGGKENEGAQPIIEFLKQTGGS